MQTGLRVQRRIGLIGGMSPRATVQYYNSLNRSSREQCELVVESMSNAEVLRLLQNGELESLSQKLVEAARSAEKGGADVLGICCNTVHFAADEIAQSISIPLVNIADSLAKRISTSSLRNVAIVCTRYTRELRVLETPLAAIGVAVRYPTDDLASLSELTLETLYRGGPISLSRRFAKLVCERLVEQGAEGIVLGCTELTLVAKQLQLHVPVFDTMRIHAADLLDLATSACETARDVRDV